MDTAGPQSTHLEWQECIAHDLVFRTEMMDRRSWALDFKPANLWADLCSKGHDEPITNLNRRDGQRLQE